MKHMYFLVVAVAVAVAVVVVEFCANQPCNTKLFKYLQFCAMHPYVQFIGFLLK
jgi:hypothetical protein